MQIYEHYQKPVLKFWIFLKSFFRKHKKCSHFHNFCRIWLINELVLTFSATIKYTKAQFNLIILHWKKCLGFISHMNIAECFQVHSRFPITRFPVTRTPFYERVTPPHNEQTIDPSSPTTTEWSALEFETLYCLRISQLFIPFSKFVKISIFLLILKTFLFSWKYSKIHLISIDILIIILLYF